MTCSHVSVLVVRFQKFSLRSRHSMLSLMLSICPAVLLWQLAVFSFRILWLAILRWKEELFTWIIRMNPLIICKALI